MKKKFFTVFLSLFLIFSNVVSSFANPLVAGIPISYELLVGLMTVGVTFGLSLPDSDSEYWDYTDSFRKHLQVVDDEYLDLLEKSVTEWKFNNNNKPDDEKEPFKIPYIPGLYTKLKELYNNVGNDLVSKSNNVYLGTSTNPLFILADSNKLDSRYKLSNYKVGVPYSTTVINKDNEYITFRFTYNGDLTYTVDTLYNGETTTVTRKISSYYDENSHVGYLVRESTKAIVLGFYNPSTRNYGNDDPGSIDWRKTYVNTNKYNVYPTYTYTPKEPNIEDNDIVIPEGVPDINIPNVETVPGYDENIEFIPPFEVSPPLDIPGDSPGDSPGSGLFPSLGSVTDYIIGLVVPSDSYWTDTWNDLYNNFISSFPMVDMSSFNSLVVDGKPFPNIDVEIMGSKGRVVNGDTVNSIVDWLRPIIAGFIFLCLMFFNYRKLYKLIRNSEPFEGIGKVENHAN